MIRMNNVRKLYFYLKLFKLISYFLLLFLALQQDKRVTLNFKLVTNGQNFINLYFIIFLLFFNRKLTKNIHNLIILFFSIYIILRKRDRFHVSGNNLKSIVLSYEMEVQTKIVSYNLFLNCMYFHSE